MTSARHAEEPMTADAFMAWYELQPDGMRYELLDGFPYVMSSERALHARVKLAICEGLKAGIAAKGLSCEAFIDGMAVRIDDTTVFEPDALVLCGPRLSDAAVIVETPVIVVEVGSPSTRNIDAITKLTRYFDNRHIMHYLIALPTVRTIIHHRRTEAGTIATSTHEEGTIQLDPPGLDLVVEGIFPAPTN